MSIVDFVKIAAWCAAGFTAYHFYGVPAMLAYVGGSLITLLLLRI